MKSSTNIDSFKVITACSAIACLTILYHRQQLSRPHPFALPLSVRRLLRRVFRPSTTLCAKATVGEIQTVCGPQSVDAIGATMMHEHLSIDARFYAGGSCCGDNLLTRSLDGSPEIWDTARRYWTKCADNLLIYDVLLLSEELNSFRAAGGGTMVDVSTTGIRTPNHAATLQEISLRTNVHVVMGAGYYLDSSVGDVVLNLSVQDLENRIVAEIVDGVDGIKAGIIGELGMAQEGVTAFNRRVLEAAAGASKRTGAAITIHPPYGVGNTVPPEKGIMEVLDILKKAGADLQRVIMGHLDRTLIDDERALKAVGKRGCFLEWDFFGWESSFFHASGKWKVEPPDDFHRIKILRKAIDLGFLEQIVVAQDICAKSRLRRYGGHGYAHVMENIVPYMRLCGFSEIEMHQILVVNPARALALCAPQ